jgi:hypothetical protein
MFGIKFKGQLITLNVIFPFFFIVCIVMVIFIWKDAIINTDGTGYLIAILLSFCGIFFAAMIITTNVLNKKKKK